MRPTPTSDGDTQTCEQVAIDRVLAGDREAFREIIARHDAAVCATIRALSHRATEWEDLSQEVFLSAYRRLDTFDAVRGTMRAWLLAIARNLCRNDVRRSRHVSIDRLEEPSDNQTPLRIASERETFELLDGALAALSDEQRLAFVLIDMQGLTYEEAAAIAETPIGTIRSRLSRAREWLREVLVPLRNDSQPDPREMTRCDDRRVSPTA
jgi:RNA polymerase sigma-70 factor, ECF subfamily